MHNTIKPRPCKAAKCDKERLPHSKIYCEAHDLKRPAICRHKGCKNHRTPESRCYCKKHFVCSYPGCKDIKSSGFTIYCKRHVDHRECTYIYPTTGKKCKRNLDCKGYCTFHSRRDRWGVSLDMPKYGSPNRRQQCEYIFSDNKQCTNKHYADGLCRVHYQRGPESMDLPVPKPHQGEPKRCLQPGCTSISGYQAKDRCRTCYNKHRKEKSASLGVMV